MLLVVLNNFNFQARWPYKRVRPQIYFAGTYYFLALTFFLPAIATRGPLWVRALVCVRWPRTGSLLR